MVERAGEEALRDDLMTERNRLLALAQTDPRAADDLQRIEEAIAELDVGKPDVAKPDVAGIPGRHF